MLHLATLDVLPSSLSTSEAIKKLVTLPICGSIPAGFPEEGDCVPVELAEINLPQSARTFQLRVRGDSMTAAGINSGDIVIFEHRNANPNDIVAALVDGKTTVKRLIMRDGKPYLKAENPGYPGFTPAQELVIQGVLVAVVRLITRKV